MHYISAVHIVHNITAVQTMFNYQYVLFVINSEIVFIQNKEFNPRRGNSPTRSGRIQRHLPGQDD